MVQNNLKKDLARIVSNKKGLVEVESLIDTKINFKIQGYDNYRVGDRVNLSYELVDKGKPIFREMNLNPITVGGYR